MNSNRKFVILLEILVITFSVISVVPVCGLSDSSADIYAYPSIVNPGDEISVTFSGAPGFYWDYIAMYKVGDPNEGEYEGAGFYLEGEKSGTLIFTAPDEPGDYEFLLFEDDGYTDIARSNVVTVVLTSSTILPTAGGLLTVESEDNELNGASLYVPAQAVTNNVTISIATTEALPNGSPFGQVPVGKLFVLLPSDLTFSVPVTLTLPIPAGEERHNLYIGRWDDTNKIWENLGGTIDGDFIATNISLTSFYGLFYSGKSTVQIINKQELDTSDLPITVMYVAGPVPPPDTPDQSHFRATRPLPPGGVELKQGESRIMELLPGRYHFLVSYPRPQPGVANSMWFTIPDLTRAQGADDRHIDQTIAIRDYGAVSTNTHTNGSILFPGRTVVGSTNFRPAINVGATVPAGVPSTFAPVNPAQIPPLVSQLEYGTNQILNIGPIKIEQLQDEGITLSATLADPEGSALKYYWTVPNGVYGGSFAPGTAASGSTVTAQFKTDRAGLYTVYLTIYDQYGLFNEGRWVILVRPNAKPYIDLVVDDVVIDFGRLDDKRRNFGAAPAPGLPRNHTIPFPNVNYLPLLIPGIPNWGVYVTPPVPGEISASTELKRLPIIDDDPRPNITAHFNPSQYPDGMTAVYAIVADADGDAIGAEFVLPTPLFGRGNMYTAIPIPDATNPITSEIKLSDGKTLAESFPDGYPLGAILDNYKVMAAYNAVLTEYANKGWLPLQPHVRTNQLLPFVAPTGPRTYIPPDVVPGMTIVFTTPPGGEFPHVIGFNQGGIRNGSINPGDIVTEAPNPLGLVPRGTVYKVILVDGSWATRNAKGYLWMIPVTDDFWDPRHSPLVPTLFVNGIPKATCSYVGQTLPVIWEAPDDPDVEQTTHDRRHVSDPSTIIPAGGTVQIEARVNDPFSPQDRAFGLVAWPTPILVGNEADLEITKTDSSDPVLAGDNLTYTLTVSNNGPSDATEVVVADTLPTNITLVSVTPSQGRATESAGVVTWNVGDLVSGASATLTIIVTVSSSAEDDSTLTNRATVSAAETDPNTADNSDTETTTVNKEGDEDEEESKTPTYLIWINKYGNAGRIHVGTNEEFERPKKYRNEWLAGMSNEYLEKEMIGGPFESMDEATNKACEMIEPYYKNILGWGKVPYAKYGGKAYHIDRDLENSCMPP